MYKTAFILGFFLLISPAFALAATPACSANGYTVVFVNGVFDTKPQAQANADALQFKIGHQHNSEPLIVQLGYNPTHLAGAGDLAQSAAQLTGWFGGSISNFDLDTILMQVYPEVTTRKLLLVGHSQGALYTNSMYGYLLSHGEPRESVAVYNVASPASYTAGGGKYLNSSGDMLLTFLRTLHFNVLPNNVDLLPTGQAGDYSGHSFANDYLANAAPQMLADIGGEMSGLRAIDASQTSDCFTPPDASLAYKTQQALFAVGDPSAVVLKVGLTTTVQAGTVALTAATKFAAGALQLFTDTITVTSQPPTPAQTDAATLQIANKLYGSSLDSLSAQDKKDLLGSTQGSAVVLAVAPVKSGVVLGTSTSLSTGTSTDIAATSTVKNIFPVSSNGVIIGGGGGGPVQGVADAAVVQTVVEVPADPAPADTTTNAATSTTDVATTTGTAPAAIDPTPIATSSIVASQPDFSGTPLHYWHSDGSDGSDEKYLILDPNDGKPGFSIGIIATTDTAVLGIHIKAQYNTDGMMGYLQKIPFLLDETGTHTYACSQEAFTGNAYGTAADATAHTNPLSADVYNNQMIDMYFGCAVGRGHETVYANTPYRLYFYPLSFADVFDVYLAANAAGVPFYEVSSDGTY